ncbi:hypothetical protein [Amphritea sp.]|uniref:hypothetical protein n=1 Tax=Amphritea sp. TaxID=1872502 RepID=UPI003D0B7803
MAPQPPGACAQAAFIRNDVLPPMLTLAGICSLHGDSVDLFFMLSGVVGFLLRNGQL